MLECLADLDSGLRALGSGLVIRHGPPERELLTLAREVGAGSVHYTADVTPFARRRAERLRRLLSEARVEPISHPGLTVVDDVGEISTASGDRHTVFTPFHRAWLEADRRPVLDPPDGLPPLPARLAKGRRPSLDALGLTQEVPDPPRGGEGAGRETAERFLAGPVGEYARLRDDLAADATSRLSPYLHFGCVSSRQLEDSLSPGAGAEAFRRQLCWRDFHHHVLLEHPRNRRSELQPRYRGTLRWSRSRRPFEAWCEGRTGYPLVDAAMRQLRHEGWIHNRARLVAGSFLTKHLGIDWRWGERWFMRLLVDGDEASNNGNWQWIASVGTDPQPAFRRILSPARQLERHDPSGGYVRRHVAELRDVPDEHLAEPWLMPDDLQLEVGCVIGEDYPAPIVDHRRAREEALERYREVSDADRARAA